MAQPRRLRPVAAAILCCLSFTSCVKTPLNIFRGRNHKPVTASSPPLRTATAEELNAIIARTFEGIHSFQASVTLTASQGNLYQGKVFAYTAAAGFILFEKPDTIRIRAQMPLTGSLAFDMVSDGEKFQFVMAPLKGPRVLFEGLNSAPATSKNKMENLRPEAFLSSMLVRPLNPVTEAMMLKDETDEEDALYRLEFNAKKADGSIAPGREIWFDREDLSIVRQMVYTQAGETVSDTRYSMWQPFNGVFFPAHIDINRRIDEYGVVIEINKEKMLMNKTLTAEQLTIPTSETEGATLKEMK